MTRDELREEIGKTDLPLRNKIVLLLAEANTSEPPVTCYDVSNSLISLLAPVLADAAKWKRFLAIQSCNDCPACPECPCDGTNCPAIKIEKALEGEGGKG